MLEPDRVRATSPRARSSTSRATCSPRSSNRAASSTARCSTGTGRTSAPSRRTAPPTRTSSTAGSRSTCRASSCASGVWLGENSDVAHRCRRRGSGAHRRQLPNRVGRGAAPVHGARRRRRREGRSQCRAQRRPRPRLHRASRRASAARCSAARATSATACASRRASSSATSRSSARAPSSTRRSRSTRSSRSSPARSSPRRSCGRAGARARCSGGAVCAASPTSTSRRKSRCGSRWRTAPRSKKGSVVCTSRDTSRSARALKRAFIAGLNLSGVHVMDLELATVPAHPFPGAQRAGPGRDHGPPRAERRRQRRDPLRRREGRRHRRRRAAQDRAAALPGGLPARVRGRHRRHRVPAARDGVLHGRARSTASTPPACSAGTSRSCSTTRTARCRS